MMAVLNVRHGISNQVHMGPMTTLYSEVWWANVPTVPLPADLVAQFAGKGMAVVGYETDSVRRTPAGDVSVPINMAYNHRKTENHFPLTHRHRGTGGPHTSSSPPPFFSFLFPPPDHDAYFTGNHSRMEKVPYDPLDLTISPMARGDPNVRDMCVHFDI